jgi:hypothetical protein
MKVRTFLVTTAILAVATASDASAQTATSKSSTRSNSTATTRLQSRPMSTSTYQRKKTSRSFLPPPPPVPTRSSRRALPRNSAGPAQRGKDETGRKDQAGKPVIFYPVVRGETPAGGGIRPSASKPNPPVGKAHENAQKDPYKMPGNSQP